MKKWVGRAGKSGRDPIQSYRAILVTFSAAGPLAA